MSNAFHWKPKAQPSDHGELSSADRRRLAGQRAATVRAAVPERNARLLVELIHRERGAVTSHDVARHFEINMSAVYSRLDSAERLGYITRLPRAGGADHIVAREKRPRRAGPFDLIP